MKSVLIRGFDSLYRRIAPKIFIDKAKRASEIARSRVLEEMIKDTDVYVPYSTGKTSQSVTRFPGNNGFEYTTDYAKYAFNPIDPSGKPKVYNTEHHEKAQGNPIQASTEANRDRWLQMYKEIFYEEFRKL